jgi:hypothetical protein
MWMALAGDIGEHNVFRPLASHAAADYIVQEWEMRGIAVRAMNNSIATTPREI